jgi:hypothetical protein
MDALNLKLKQVKANIIIDRLKGEEKTQLLSDIETDITKAMVHINDHKLLKRTVLQVSEKFLCDKSRKKASSGGGGTNAEKEKLRALERKIATATSTIEQKKKTHANEMAQLRRQHGSLSKASSLL